MDDIDKKLHDTVIARIEKLENDLVLLRRSVWQSSLIGPVGDIMNCDAVAYNKEK